MTYDKKELEELSIKYFGLNHAKLSFTEKMEQIFPPIDSGLARIVAEADKRLSPEGADQILYNILKANEAVPAVLEELRKAKAQKQK